MLGKVLILAWGASWPMAAAAPWVQEDGGLYTRGAVGQEEVDGLTGVRTDLYAEYGLTSKLTLTGKVDYVSYTDASDFDADGWRTSLRYQLATVGALVWSAEAGALQGAAIGGRNGCDALGGEIRSGLAWSGEWRSRQIFVFGEAASRFHSGCQRDRFAFGLGQQTDDHIWSVTQVWLEDGDINARSVKFQSELVWRTNAADFSFGYRQENGGDFEEQSLFLALARQF